MTVYVDGYILLNFFTDYLLLLGTARLSGIAVTGWRLPIAALVGAAFGGLSLAPGFGFLSGSLWPGVFLLLMLCIAFGWNRGLLRRGLIFLILTMALGGGGYLLEKNACLGFFTLAGLGLLLALGCRALSLGAFPSARELVQVKIRLGKREATLTALRDTGNSLRDPISGQPVLVAQWEAARKLLPIPLSREELIQPAQTMASLAGRAPELRFRLIPYKTVGTEGGMLLAVRCDRVEAAGSALGQLVAFSPTTLCESGTYQALTGGIA